MDFIAVVEPNSEPSTNDNLPSFFLSNNKTGKENFGNEKKTYETNLNTTSSSTNTEKTTKIIKGIHWPSLVIGAIIAISCTLCGVLIANMMDTDTLPILDETAQKQSDITKKQTLSLYIDNASPPLGNPNAPITMIEFGDYQCTFCNKFFHETENSIVTNYINTGKVKILFKDFIILGQDSINAANAAHCANDQKLFWEYHSILYNNWDGEDTGWAGLVHLHEFASMLELDMPIFSKCMSDLKWNKLVNLSNMDGHAVGVTGTPTFFVIDQNNDIIKITGAQRYDVFKQVFDSMLDG